MTTKHTPGPWHVAGTGNHQAVIVAEADGTNIAVVYDEKDADVLAAAPELLEALEKITADMNDESDGTCDTLWEEVAEARAAIAKAKGES